MKVFKNAVLTVLILALVVSVCGCAFGGSKKIGKNAALQAALEASAWYEVDFESGRAEYEYRINAYTGEVLSSATD